MGWEKRGGKSYYYRKVRNGNRVRSKYVGNNFYAQLHAHSIETSRRARRDERENLRRMQQADKDIDRQIADVEKVVVELTDASFYAAGYHKHKGQWRRKREATASTI